MTDEQRAAIIQEELGRTLEEFERSGEIPATADLVGIIYSCIRAGSEGYETQVPFSEQPSKSSCRSMAEEVLRLFEAAKPLAKVSTGAGNGTGAGGRKSKQAGLIQPAKKTVLRPEDEFRVYQPAPVISINRYGVVRWITDGPKHKAGELLIPRNSQGRQTVRFRYNGERHERSTGWMLETVGWIKPRGKSNGGITPINE